MNEYHSILDEIEAGKKLAEEGMIIARDHADQVEKGWSERTWEQFIKWLEGKPAGFEFMMEEFRAIAETPTIGQAFGFISKRAVREGLIKFYGYSRTKNKVSHSRPANVWRKV